MKKRAMGLIVGVMALGTVVGTSQAVDLYSSGTKPWNTTSNNWGSAPGVYSGTTWNNATPDSAIFEGTAGTVTLGEAITVSNIVFNTANYIVSSNTLNFAAGGAITQSAQQKKLTITSSITGGPSVGIADASHSPAYTEVAFLPTRANQTLGVCTVPYDDGDYGDKGRLRLGGTTTGNSVSRIEYQGGANKYGHMIKEGSGTWTVGDVTIGIVYLNAGTFVVNGTLDTHYQNLNFSGGTLAGTGTINDPVSVPASGVLAPGDPTGTLTVTNNNCTINGTLTIHVDSRRSPVCSLLAVDAGKTLDITGATLDVTVGESPGGALVIARYGTLTGTFGTVNLPEGWAINYEYDLGTAIAVIASPPGTVLLVR